MRLQSIIPEAIMGASQYQPPADVKQLMADFYTLDLLQNGIQHLSSERGEMIDYELRSVERILLPYLQEHLLRKAGNAIASELRHIFSQTLPQDGRINNLMAEYLPERAMDILKGAAQIRTGVAKDPRWEGLTQPYHHDYARLGVAAFNPSGPLTWENQYGGEPWYKSCVTWLELENAKAGELRMRIDRIYQMQHNNGSLLDKNVEYQGQWLEVLLDIKHDANDPEQLAKYASPFIRKLAGFVLRDRYGRSNSMEPKPIVDYKQFVFDSIMSATSILDNHHVNFRIDDKTSSHAGFVWVAPIRLILEVPNTELKLLIEFCVPKNEQLIHVRSNNPPEPAWYTDKMVRIYKPKPKSYQFTDTFVQDIAKAVESCWALLNTNLR